MRFLIVFIGSGIGGCLRLTISELTKNYTKIQFPIGTLLSNFIACFILGIIVGLSNFIDNNTKLLFTVGICGGFSTFSTFSHESLQMLLSNKYLDFITYILASIFSCIFAVYIGILILKQFS